MSHAPFEAGLPGQPRDPRPSGVLGGLDRAMRALNGVIFVVSSIALVVAALVLTEGVTARNLLGHSSEWQEEVTVFLLLGAMFLSMASVQAKRGHIGIDALTGILPGGVDRVRRVVVDIVSLVFVAYFAWKCCQLLHEAVVEDEHTMSTWGPPLWIPYGLMAAGMVLLAVQIALQVVIDLVVKRKDVQS